MKSFLLFLLLLSVGGSKATAFSRPDIDTVSLIGLTPGLDGKEVHSYVHTHLDTLLWDNASGIGIVKFGSSFLGSKGDFRLAYQNGFVSQVSFVAPTKSAQESGSTYEQLSQQLIESFGPADIETTNSIHERRWEGLRQSISIKWIDGDQYVTVALSKFEMQK